MLVTEEYIVMKKDVLRNALTLLFPPSTEHSTSHTSIKEDRYTVVNWWQGCKRVLQKHIQICSMETNESQEKLSNILDEKLERVY